MVDNSQGHCAFSEDALLVSCMNLRPGGKQARMQNGWYFNNVGMKVSQAMIFPPDHPDHLDKPKGMKQVLLEWGLWNNKLNMQCKACPNNGTACCAKHILELQPDFKGQKSLVQKVIEAAGHLCIILPKFHCELNFIEYFGGAIKQWIHEHCDYTFVTLQVNMPQALASVDALLIRKWQNHMMWWMDAYWARLNAKDVQMSIQAFSSRKYTSHFHVPNHDYIIIASSGHMECSKII